VRRIGWVWRVERTRKIRSLKDKTSLGPSVWLRELLEKQDLRVWNQLDWFRILKREREYKKGRQRWKSKEEK
jgi:hypothetical protein